MLPRVSVKMCKMITNKEDEINNNRSPLSILAFGVWTFSIGLSAKESGEGEDDKGDEGGELRLSAVGCSRDTKSENTVFKMFRDPREEVGLPTRPGEVRLGTHSDCAVWIMNKELSCHWSMLWDARLRRRREQWDCFGEWTMFVVLLRVLDAT